MEIKVGEYIRTKHSIGKVENIGGLENELVYFKNCECLKCVDKTEIKKHSPNIIDLIEVGDYVNKKRVTGVDIKKHKVYVEEAYYFKKKDIETIFTHEQMEEMEYKL